MLIGKINQSTLGADMVQCAGHFNKILAGIQRLPEMRKNKAQQIAGMLAGRSVLSSYAESLACESCEFF